ncbi:MAG: hypothetical protein Q9219_005940 [cf. Caloplaca sp. 3 TL-2023]
MAKRTHTPDPDPACAIYRSGPIHDRSSKFIASFSPLSSMRDLQGTPDFATAMHRMAAWRKLSDQRSLNSQPIYDVGHDDDGEKHGGKTLERVLVTMNVVGVVVVARWYGGTLLGPVRFDHIRTCAMEAIGKWRMEGQKPTKQVKLQDDTVKREELAAVLLERDQNIIVLRQLLAQKKGTSPSRKGEKNNTMDYSKMSLSVLQRIENGRDATIGWILKEIEKAEQAEAPGKPEVAETSDADCALKASQAETSLKSTSDGEKDTQTT